MCIFESQGNKLYIKIKIPRRRTVKVEWLGANYWQADRVQANDLAKSNIPMMRCMFRQETFRSEQDYLAKEE